jgi:hypothetical protein
MNIQELLGNNMAILDQHTRREARPGLWILTFPGEFMPDGYDVEHQIKGQVTHASLQEFCNVIRETYNARIGKQEAAATEPSDTRDTSSEGGDPAPRVASRVEVSAATPVPSVEDTLEDVLRSQVLKLRDSISYVEDRISERGTERTRLLNELKKCEAALEAYEGEPKTKPKPVRKRKTKAKPKPQEKVNESSTNTVRTDADQ